MSAEAICRFRQGWSWNKITEQIKTEIKAYKFNEFKVDLEPVHAGWLAHAFKKAKKNYSP